MLIVYSFWIEYQVITVWCLVECFWVAFMQKITENWKYTFINILQFHLWLEIDQLWSSNISLLFGSLRSFSEKGSNLYTIRNLLLLPFLTKYFPTISFADQNSVLYHFTSFFELEMVKDSSLFVMFALCSKLVRSLTTCWDRYGRHSEIDSFLSKK